MRDYKPHSHATTRNSLKGSFLMLSGLEHLTSWWQTTRATSNHWHEHKCCYSFSMYPCGFLCLILFSLSLRFGLCCCCVFPCLFGFQLFVFVPFSFCLERLVLCCVVCFPCCHETNRGQDLNRPDTLDEASHVNTSPRPPAFHGHIFEKWLQKYSRNWVLFRPTFLSL